jgi:hypothetical protein
MPHTYSSLRPVKLPLLRMTTSGVLPGANVELRQEGYEPAEWHKAVHSDPPQQPHATPSTMSGKCCYTPQP